jgi:hypothetical protein
MRIVGEYSHFGGAEILKVRFPHIDREIEETVAATTFGEIDADSETESETEEATASMCRWFEQALNDQGYEALLSTVEAPGAGDVFAKDRVVVKVQADEQLALLCDMAKFQYFFNESKADVGIEIVPCHTLKKRMSTGVSYGEQLVYDIERLKRHFPAVPVKVILVDANS